MVVASLLPYLRDRDRGMSLVAAVAMSIVALALLACVAFAGAAMVDSSVVDGQLVGPFRWGQIEAGDG